MEKVFNDAIEQISRQPGKLPAHYTADLVIRNYDEVCEAVAQLRSAISDAQIAISKLSESMHGFGIELGKEMTMICDDGQVFEHIEHSVSFSDLVKNLAHD